MSYNDYIRASKMGQKDYQSKLIAGEIPTLEALDDILHETRDYREVSIGLVQIPLDQIVGTKTREEVILFPVILCLFLMWILNLPASG